MPQNPDIAAAVHVFPCGTNRQLAIPGVAYLAIAGKSYESLLAAGFFKKPYREPTVLALVVHDPMVARDMAAALRQTAADLEQQAAILDLNAKKGA